MRSTFAAVPAQAGIHTMTKHNLFLSVFISGKNDLSITKTYHVTTSLPPRR